MGSRRKTLQNSGAVALEMFARHPAVALLDVPVETVADLRRLHGFMVEPAFRRDRALLIHASRPFDRLTPEEFVEPAYAHAWTLERLHFVARRYLLEPAGPFLPPMTAIEKRLLAAMRELDLRPRVRFDLGGSRAAFAFPERRLVVEADGREWHDAHRARRRDRKLATLGWTVLRYPAGRIEAEAGACAPEIAAMYRSLPETAGNGDRPLRLDRPGKPPGNPPIRDDLDPDQRAAVAAHEGVIQVIAPAGSGKTRVLVARARELVDRGIPEERILCTTFNKATRVELRERLGQVVLHAIEVRTFHSIGHHVLRRERRLRKHVGELPYPRWRRLCGLALHEKEGRVWIDAPDAKEAVSDYKLARMITPAEAGARATGPFEETAARIYALYEEELERADLHDFDDLIVQAVRLLRTEPPARRRWQARWECVLVDEYQDVEPAQELLVQILAAPQDCLMVVGDEDQCIYTWRRAEVEKIIDLDKRYPGLERIVLSTCYRCPPKVVAAASRLVRHNERRFPKKIQAGRKDRGAISIAVQAMEDLESGASSIAASLSASEPGETVVLARTSRLLRMVATACSARGVPFTANERVLRPAGSERVVLAYLRLLADPGEASPEDVARVFRVPNRSLPPRGEREVARRLRQGASFRDAVRRLDVDEWRAARLAAGAELLDRLTGEIDAGRLVHALRTDGGLGAHYVDHERMTSHDLVEIEALIAVESEAWNRSPEEVANDIESRMQLLENSEKGIGTELVTIHGAKGREWRTVIVFGYDDDHLPHRRVLDEVRERTIEGAGKSLLEQAIEDERRLAYVAMTRATARLRLVHTSGNPSRFLGEAGLSPGKLDAQTAQSS